MADHDRVRIVSTPMSCGIAELSSITDPLGALYQIASRLYHPSRGDPVALILASDIIADVSSENGGVNTYQMFREVRELRLGTVYTSEGVENPKTGNVIVLYTWFIDHEAFKVWYSKQRVKKLAKVGT
jgi:hypothetical protein